MVGGIRFGDVNQYALPSCCVISLLIMFRKKTYRYKFGVDYW